MNKTKVDDMLINMIQPKLTEIEEKFSRGDGLDQEDINTLLLKSQYNHINHLDQKLDEVTDDVSNLRSEFKELKTDLYSKFNKLETTVKNEISEMKKDNEIFKKEVYSRFDKMEVTIQKTVNSNMRWGYSMVGFVVIAMKALDLFV
jgi:uncharacterized coiled-coil DUF342 family protein